MFVFVKEFFFGLGIQNFCYIFYYYLNVNYITSIHIQYSGVLPVQLKVVGLEDHGEKNIP